MEKVVLDGESTRVIVKALISEWINRKLYGEALTILDASSKDVESRKAIRSLISQAFTRNTRQLVSSIDKIYSEVK